MKNSIARKIRRFDLIQQTNSFFYWLYSSPVLKRFFHSDLVEEYESKEGIELAFNSLNFLRTVSRKILYLLIIYVIAIADSENCFGALFFLLTVMGGLLRRIINFDVKAYNNVILMKVNPGDYAKVQIDDYLKKQFFTLLTAFFPMTYYLEISYQMAVAFVLIYLAIHLILEQFHVMEIIRNNFEADLPKGRQRLNLLFLAAAGILIYFCVSGMIRIENKHVALSVLALVPVAVSSYMYLVNRVNYVRFFRHNLSIEKITKTEEIVVAGRTSVNMSEMRKGLKAIGIKSRKKGYEFLFDAFKERYRNTFSKSLKIEVIIVLIIGAALLLSPVLIDFIDGPMMVDFIVSNMRYFFLIIYIFAQTGKSFIVSCFLQIDRYLVNYNFFRRTQDIGENFKIRLKAVISSTMIPTLLTLFFISLCYILYSSSFEAKTLIMLIVFPVALAVFYPVYNLSAYYLFQPYSYEGQVVNKAYSVVDYLVYLISYLTWQIEFRMNIYVLVFIIITCAIISAGLYSAVMKRSPRKFRVR